MMSGNAPVFKRPDIRPSALPGRRWFPFLLFVLLSAAAFAQTAGRLDAVLAAGQVSFAQAAALVLPAAGLLDPASEPDAAFEQARPAFPRWADKSAFISMGELSHLVMRSFGLSGGFMYALFPGPRYAYRALAWRRILPLDPDPYRTVSGGELLYIIGQTLSLTGEPDPALPGEPPPEIRPKPGQGLSAGPEDIIPWREDFEVE
jgi:hypothetical protein